jgi:hypothetical protein
MKAKFVATIIGVFLGIIATIFWPRPFIASLRDKPPEYVDKNQQEFIARFIDTFEAGNPYTEDFDEESFEINDYKKRNEIPLNNYYREFQQVIKKITPNRCPTINVVVDSKNQSDEAKIREFIVFDIKNCISSK